MNDDYFCDFSILYNQKKIITKILSTDNFVPYVLTTLSSIDSIPFKSNGNEGIIRT